MRRTLGHLLIGFAAYVRDAGAWLARVEFHPAEQSNAELDAAMNGTGTARRVPHPRR